MKAGYTIRARGVSSQVSLFMKNLHITFVVLIIGTWVTDIISKSYIPLFFLLFVIPSILQVIIIRLHRIRLFPEYMIVSSWLQSEKIFYSDIASISTNLAVTQWRQPKLSRTELKKRYLHFWDTEHDHLLSVDFYFLGEHATPFVDYVLSRNPEIQIADTHATFLDS